MKKILTEIPEEKFEKLLDRLADGMPDKNGRGSLAYCNRLCHVIGAITAYAGEDTERVFTESQLERIFELTI